MYADTSARLDLAAELPRSHHRPVDDLVADAVWLAGLTSLTLEVAGFVRRRGLLIDQRRNRYSTILCQLAIADTNI